MSRVIPSKVVAMQKAIGVDSLKEIKPEKIRLSTQRGLSAVYSPQDRISFRLPAYSNSMLDQSQTFLSFKVTTNDDGDPIDKTVKLPVFGTGAPVFSRMTVKSAAGLVLEDTTNFDVLRKLFTVINQEPAYGRFEGIYATVEPTDTLGVSLKTGWDLTARFDTGLLSQHMASYLPLFMMDGGAGYALDIELTVNDAGRAFRLTETETYTKIGFTLTNVALNLSLLRMDESLCAKFNSIACDPNEEIRIPYTTMRAHQTSIADKTSVTRIHETCSSLKRLWACMLSSTQAVDTTRVLKLLGADTGSTNDGLVVKSYQYKVGSQFVYNEPVVCTKTNGETIQHIMNALWFKPGEKPMLAASTGDLSVFADAVTGSFVTVASFDYSSEASAGVVQGISSSTPIEYIMELNSKPTNAHDLTLFAECQYDLVIRRGQVTYEECKPGSNVVY